MDVMKKIKESMKYVSSRIKVSEELAKRELKKHSRDGLAKSGAEKVKAVLLSLVENDVITPEEYKEYLKLYNFQDDYALNISYEDFLDEVFEAHPKAMKLKSIPNQIGIETELYRANGGVLVPFKEGGFRYYPDAKVEIAKALEVLKAEAERNQKELDDFCEENKEYLELIDKLEKAKELRAIRNNMTRKAKNSAWMYEDGVRYLEEQTVPIDREIAEAVQE